MYVFCTRCDDYICFVRTGSLPPNVCSSQAPEGGIKVISRLECRSTRVTFTLESALLALHSQYIACKYRYRIFVAVPDFEGNLTFLEVYPEKHRCVSCMLIAE